MKKRSLKLVSVLLLLASVATGCGSSKMNAVDNAAYETAYDVAEAGYGYVASNTAAASADVEYEYDAAAAADPYYDEGAAEARSLMEENANASNRKLIKTVDMYVETEAYDTLLVNLAKRITELGGYIEYQYDYNGKLYSEYNENRNANWEIRIPVAHLDEFVNHVGEEANIIDKTERITDVTLQYVDLESHKTALLTEQKRLLEILEQAENVEDIIAIEQRLSEVRYELENMESQLRLLDNKIDYSTVNLNIQEVKRVVRVEENSVWDRIRNGFAETLYDLGDSIVDGFVELIINSPYIVIWAVVIFVIVLVIRAVVKRRRAKERQNMQQWTEEVREQCEKIKLKETDEEKKEDEPKPE